MKATKKPASKQAPKAAKAAEAPKSKKKAKQQRKPRAEFTYADFKKAEAAGKVVPRDWLTYNGNYAVAEFEDGRCAVFHEEFSWRVRLYRKAEFKSAHRNKADAEKAATKYAEADDAASDKIRNAKVAEIRKGKAEVDAAVQAAAAKEAAKVAAQIAEEKAAKKAKAKPAPEAPKAALKIHKSRVA